MTGLLQVPFFDDEIFTSFVSRTARANGFGLSAAFTEMLGVNYDRLLVGDSVELEAFRSRAGLPDGWISERTISLDMGLDVSPSERAYQRKLISKKRIRYCPACLEEDDARHERMTGTRRYRRKAWIFRAVKSCAYHNCSIVESSVMLNTRNRDDFCLFLDRLDASGELETARSERHCGPLEVFIHERVAGHKNHGTLLDGLPLALAIDFSLILGASLELGKVRRLSTLSDEEEAIAGDRGFEALRKAHDGLTKALDAITSDTSFRLNSTFGGYFIYGRLYEVLAHQRFDPEYDQIRKLIRDYAMNRFPILDGADLFGSVGDSRWTSAQQIARALHMSVSRVENVARRCGVTPEIHMSKDDGVRVCDAIEEDARNRFTKAEGARIVGCSIWQFGTIEARGLLGPTSGSLDLDISRKARAEALLTEIASAVNSEVEPKMVTLAAYSKTYFLALAEVLKQVIDGRFRRVARQVHPELAHSLMVLDEGQALVSKDALSAQEAGEILQVSSHVVLCLIRHGMLKSVKSAERSRINAIRLDEVERFKERFISASGFAKLCGVHTNTVLSTLKKLSLQPAFSNKKYRAYFLNREDLSAIRGQLPE